jgi:hypothetical protein
MFELVGYVLMRMVGLGWLWGRESFDQLTLELEEDDGDLRLVRHKPDVFGNGGMFLPIGMAFCGVCAVVICVLAR